MTEKASPSIFDAVIIGACSGFATAEMATEVKTFAGACHCSEADVGVLSSEPLSFTS